MKRRKYLGALATLGLLAGGGYVLTQEEPPGEQLPGESTATPTPTASATPTQTATSSPSPTATQNPAFGGKKIHGEMSLTVLDAATEPTVTIDGEQRQPGEGNVFLLVELVAKNEGESLDKPPSDLTYVHEGTEYEAKGTSTGAEEMESPQKKLYDGDGGIGAGVTRDGWVFGAIPESVDQLTFRWHYTSFKAEERDIEWEIPVPE